MKIGVLIIATNKYLPFAEKLIHSLQGQFLPEEQVTTYLFTNHHIGNLPATYIEVEHKPWPAMTLDRYEIFWQNRAKLAGEDYLFYLDADSLVCGYVGKEILPDKNKDQVTAVVHPGFFRGGGSWETNPLSTAYVRPSHRIKYYAGGFNGARTDYFLFMSEYLKYRIEADRLDGITAVHNDESHLNCFVSNVYSSVKELTPEYMWPENCDWFKPVPNWTPKIIALSKNHDEVRS